MINSTEWAWADMSFALNGVRVVRITKFICKTKRDSEHQYGEGDDPFAIGLGNKDYTGELEVYATVIAKMNRAAVAAGGDDLTDVPWTVSIDYKATKTDPRQKITVPELYIEEFEEGGSNNDKGMKKTLPFKCLKPIRS